MTSRYRSDEASEKLSTTSRVRRPSRARCSSVLMADPLDAAGGVTSLVRSAICGPAPARVDLPSLIGEDSFAVAGISIVTLCGYAPAQRLPLGERGRKSMLVTRRRKRRSILVALAAVSATVATLLPVGAARADDPLFIGWSKALPSFAWTYDLGSSDECVSGRISCVDKVIDRMQKRLDPLAV